MSSICRYYQKTEIVFDENFKSKSGKLIPLDKASGSPHQCAENPYTKQQQQQTQKESSQSPTLPSIEQIHNLLASMDGKLERLLNLLERGK